MTEIIKYANGLNANEEVLGWINTVYKNYASKNPTTHEIEHIIDFLVSSAAPQRLRKMSYVDARRKADEWSTANQKKGKNLLDSEDDIEIVHDFLDGTRIVRLKTKKAYQREGFLMNHCIGGYSPDDKNCLIYSYRDEKNLPHATFEVQKEDNSINQIKGKGNGPIHPRYIEPILAFLKVLGMDIRPRDMQNLGYYHIHKEHTVYIKRAAGAKANIVVLYGETYVHE